MKPSVSALREKFASEYKYSIPTDLKQFLDFVNEKDPNLEWRADWYLALFPEKARDGSPAPPPRYIAEKPTVLPPNSISGFKAAHDRMQRDFDKTGVKIAECSNFAYHAMYKLLSDPNVTDNYNVCIAGIGKQQNHNIVLLLPKDPMDPIGRLIVDPWAMAMGHNAEVSLAVTPEEYILEKMLDQKIVLGYQSIYDPLVTPGAVSPSPSMLRSASTSRSKTSPGMTSSSESPPAITPSRVTTDYVPVTTGRRPSSAPATSGNMPSSIAQRPSTAPGYVSSPAITSGAVTTDRRRGPATTPRPTTAQPISPIAPTTRSTQMSPGVSELAKLFSPPSIAIKTDLQQLKRDQPVAAEKPKTTGNPPRNDRTPNR